MSGHYYNKHPLQMKDKSSSLMKSPHDFCSLNFTGTGEGNGSAEKVFVTNQQAFTDHVIDNGTDLIGFNESWANGQEVLWNGLTYTEALNVSQDSLFKSGDDELSHVEIPMLSRFDGISISKMRFMVNKYFNINQKASIKRLYERQWID
jgi:hypothetical protein